MKTAIFGFSNEMDCLSIKRRPGCENGPAQLVKGLRLCNFKAINDPQSLYLDFFDLIGTSSTAFSSASFQQKLLPVFERLSETDTAVCIGGGCNALIELLELNPHKPDWIIKVSPHLGRAAPGDLPHNLSFLSHLDAQTRSRVLHFGVVDYLASQEEVDRVLLEDKAQVHFFEKYSADHLAGYRALLAGLPPGAKVWLLLDCEALDASYFPGVSQPGIFGFSQQDAVGMVASLRGSDKFLTTAIFANYNPTVEPRRSAEFLTFLIYSLLKADSEARKVKA